MYCDADFSLLTDVLHVASTMNSVRKDWTVPCRILVNSWIKYQSTLPQMYTSNWFWLIRWISSPRLTSSYNMGDRILKSLLLLYDIVSETNLFALFFCTVPKPEEWYCSLPIIHNLHIHVLKHNPPLMFRILK